MFSVATVWRSVCELDDGGVVRGGKMEIRTGFDVASGVDHAGSGAPGTDIYSDIVVLTRVQIIVRTYRHGEQKLRKRGSRKEGRKESCNIERRRRGSTSNRTYSVEACCEDFLKFCQ